MKVHQKTIIVTGAGSGMGREIVLELLNRGARVAAVDINEETLRETQQIAGNKAARLSLHILDIRDETAIQKLPENVIEAHGSLDGVINNAGVIQPFVPVSEIDMEKIRFVMDVNFYGTVYMVKTLPPYFEKNTEAHIVNVSSMGGFLPVPGQSIYGASKAAVKLMTEGLHSELKDTHIRVSVVFPGAINTNIMENSQVDRGPSAGDNEEMANKITTAPAAAKIILDGMENDKYRIFVGNDSKLMDLFYRVMPKKAAAIIAEKLK